VAFGPANGSPPEQWTLFFPGIFHSISDSSVDLQIAFEMQMNFESDKTSF
jgi:hypothetical protein